VVRFGAAAVLVFNAPPVTQAQLFASLPETLRVRNCPSALAQALGTQLDSFLEGPCFDASGNLYCVDVLYGRIFRVCPNGGFELVVQYDGEPNGLKFHRDGRLFVADRRRGILVVDPSRHQPEVILDRYDLEPFRGPNDLVFSPEGDLYFTDQGLSDIANPTGRVFRLRSNGRVDLILDSLAGPNGIAMDSTGRILYVALTRANSIIRAPLQDDGRVWRVQTYIQLSGGGGPDGIAIDSKGGIAVAHPQMGAIWLFDSRGQPTLRVDLSQGLWPTNLAYGGADRRRLYITEAETGTIHFAELPAAA
jgi:gluconolactonase